MSSVCQDKRSTYKSQLHFHVTARNNLKIKKNPFGIAQKIVGPLEITLTKEVQNCTIIHC
jgi:hypothetical protein